MAEKNLKQQFFEELIRTAGVQLSQSARIRRLELTQRLLWLIVAALALGQVVLVWTLF